MSATNWSPEFDPVLISKRAKGRDRYNTRRQGAAILRRWEAGKLLEQVGAFKRGWKAKLARLLGVHRSTIGRDFEAETHRDALCWLLRAGHYEMMGEPLIADLFRYEFEQHIEEFEYYRRLSAKLDRRRRLGLPW